MAVYGKSGFFNARVTDRGYDREYDAGDFAQYNALLVRSGVFATPEGQLKVSASGGLNLNIDAGAAMIDGHYFILPEDAEMNVPLNTTTTEKLYYVCCTLSLSDREIDLKLREAGTDTRPVNNGNIHELILCSFSLGVGVTIITNAMITDTRPDDDMCGWVRGMAELDQILLSMIKESYETLSNRIQVLENESEKKISKLNSDLKNVVKVIETIFTYEVTNNNTNNDGYIRQYLHVTKPSGKWDIISCELFKLVDSSDELSIDPYDLLLTHREYINTSNGKNMYQLYIVMSIYKGYIGKNVEIGIRTTFINKNII